MKCSLEKGKQIIDGKEVEASLFHIDFGGVIFCKSLVEFQQLLYTAQLFRKLSEKEFQQLLKMKDKYWSQCINNDDCKERENFIHSATEFIICKKHKIIINRILQIKRS